MPAVTLLLLSAIAVAWLDLRPRPDRPIAVVFPPWWRAAAVFRAAAHAEGVIIRTGAWPTILVVQSPDPMFQARLRNAGAVLLLDAQALGGCLAKG